MSLTLYFLRFAFFVNIALFVMWGLACVAPFVSHPPATFSWRIFQVYTPAQLIQGYGLGDTFFLYGVEAPNLIPFA